MKTETRNPNLFYEDSVRERKIKEQIITKEVKEMELVRDLRAVRGEIEELRRELKK